jgi:Flp pilus assembly pilin Flp
MASGPGGTFSSEGGFPPRIREQQNMRALIQHIRDFAQAEDGPTIVEYAVMAALVAVVALTAISTFQPRQQTLVVPAAAPAPTSESK